MSWKGALIRCNGSSTLKCRRTMHATRKYNTPRWVNKHSQGNRNRWGFLQFQNGAALHITDKGSQAKMWSLMETELSLLGVSRLSKVAKAPEGHSDWQHAPFSYRYRHRGQCLGRAFTCLEWAEGFPHKSTPKGGGYISSTLRCGCWEMANRHAQSHAAGQWQHLGKWRSPWKQRELLPTEV